MRILLPLILRSTIPTQRIHSLLHAAMEEVEAPRKGYSGLNGAGAGLRKVSDKFWNWVTQAL